MRLINSSLSVGNSAIGLVETQHQQSDVVVRNYLNKSDTVEEPKYLSNILFYKVFCVLVLRRSAGFLTLRCRKAYVGVQGFLR